MAIECADGDEVAAGRVTALAIEGTVAET